ncbi:uncharacterized protein LOC143028198 isoform X1 [Oratosquilla oratoria]|uniref:uncharacterized protein LOC143028198 isoform X1 n=1 Tax=Oratosquilla oratoria TaxID=337810 RepID=UPI003F75AE5E
MDQRIVLIVVASLLRGTWATAFETQHADFGPTVELIDDLRSVLREISLAFNAESRISTMETEIKVAGSHIKEIQEDIKDLKTKMQETFHAGQLFKTQFETTMALLDKIPQNKLTSDDVDQKIKASSDKLSVKLVSLETRLAEMERSVAKNTEKVAAHSVAMADLENVTSRVSKLEDGYQALNKSLNETLQAAQVRKDWECPSPYQLVKNDCLFVVSDVLMSWEKARENCKAKAKALNMDGDLAVPSDIPAFLEFMKKSDEGVPWSWIGAFADDGNATKWKWLRDSSISLDKSSFQWDGNEPTRSTVEKAMCLSRSALKFHNCKNAHALHSVCQIFVNTDQ